MKFIIATLGRVNKQITYNNLPDKYKEKTVFVVQTHEYDIMNEKYPNKVICLPEDVKNLGQTRQFIFKHFRGERYWTWDDDLGFIVKDWVNNEKHKWATRKMIEEDFDEFVNQANDFMDKGCVSGGLASPWIMPAYRPNVYPFHENFRQCTNMFFDGLNMPEVDFRRADTVEDMDGTLQMITQGYKNVVFTRHRVVCSDTNSEGGCEVYRTIEYHNNSMRTFQSLWPDYVKLKEKVQKTGPWKGLPKLAVEVQWKKAYADGIKKRTQSVLPFK